ncbi:hypothetical protein [Clostridium sp. HBUAS56010]|uniref:hypothetical protein n=1 Tax=Clostridium sp. HBUAS56010 TaxID=2571127 RepID=UPI001178679C|nr:hypothetical protein [Clostridium sp. HBUAS56010]
MGDGFIIHGGGTDTSELTAEPSDVAESQKFYGAGSDDISEGVLKDNGSIRYKLPVNTTYTIPAGFHGQGEVYQDTQTVEGDIIINPTPGGSSSGIKDKFFKSNVIINGIENLVPENIKKGIFIGEIAGEWEGYVNGELLQPYWYGIFAPGQTGRLIDNRNPATGSSISFPSVTWYADDPETGGKVILFSSPPKSSAGNGNVYPAIRTETPVEMEGVRSVTICYSLPNHSANEYTWIVLAENSSYQVTKDNSWTISPELGAHENFSLPATGNAYGTQTFILNNAAAYHYIYIGIGVAPTTSQGRFMRVRYIKLNK